MSKAGHNLYRETEAAKTLRAQMADILGDDEELAADTIEGQTDLNEAIDVAVQQLVDDTASLEGLKAMIENLVRRKVRYEERIKNMKTALCVAFEQAGKKKHEHAAVTLSLRNVPASATITDESAIPSTFWKRQDPKLDKRAVLEALKDKQDVPGATLNNGGSTIACKWS